MNPKVSTRHGKVCGEVVDGISVFKGIPFAAPPFGAFRLLPPGPVESWSGVRDALSFGPKSPQVPYPPQIRGLIPELTDPGEDCLSLNVWSSALGSARQPVMVWIPGGMFEFHATGACPWYEGSAFARSGIVCVSINYRVGAEGFLFLDRGNANRGLLDQIAALEWVRDNIAAFGGDPDNITIFGESAGALSIGALLAMPRAEGLFRRAILESGAANHATSGGNARRLAHFVAEKLGVLSTRDALAAIPPSCLLEAQAEIRAELEANPDPNHWGTDFTTTMLPWQPAIDGDILPALPIHRIAAGSATDVDLMVGTNTDEHRLFFVPGGIERIPLDAVRSAIRAYGLPVESTLDWYRSKYPEACAGDLFAAIQTDWYWRIPAIRLADVHARCRSATYMYEFAWHSPAFDGQLGACHSLEIPFVFRSFGQSTELLWGSDPPLQLAEGMHAAWAAFARIGDPGWPKYDLGRRATMRFDIASRIEDDPRLAERTLWQTVR